MSKIKSSDIIRNIDVGEGIQKVKVSIIDLGHTTTRYSYLKIRCPNCGATRNYNNKCEYCGT